MRGVGLAHGVQLPQIRSLLTERFQETGLADAGFARDLDQASGARARAGKRFANDSKFGLATDKG